MTITEQVFGLLPGQPNAGYVRALWLLRAADVLGLLSPQELPVAGQPLTVSKAGLLVRPGAMLSRIKPMTKTATFEEAGDKESAGFSYAPRLQVPMPKPAPEFDYYLSRYAATRWVVFWVDYNGQGWIAGQPDNGLRLSLSRLQGATNGLLLTFMGRSHHAAWRLESTDPEVLFVNSAFDIGFNLSYDS